MRTERRFTIHDLELCPDDGNRYEIIDGELYVSRQPHWHHQQTFARITAALLADDVVTSPLLPGFSASVRYLRAAPR